jgi:hypothetical protein
MNKPIATAAMVLASTLILSACGQKSEPPAPAAAPVAAAPAAAPAADQAAPAAAKPDESQNSGDVLKK